MHFRQWKRREFMTLLGGAAAWPLAARAQQGERMRRIGVLSALREDDPEWVARRAAFEQALQALGWTIGRDLRIDYRSTGIDPATIEKFAAELAALAPDVILPTTNSVIAPMLRAARSTPIVLTQVIDPVGSGYVRSMARPGGNVTGFTQFEYSLAGKWLELLKEIAPHVTRVGVLRDPTRGPGIGQFAVIQAIGTAACGGTDADRCARSGRDPEQGNSGICELPEQRDDRDGGSASGSSGCGDCRCCKEPPAYNLSLSLLRGRWGPDLLWS